MAGVEHQSPPNSPAAEGHHDLIGQPHSDEEGPVAEAEILAAEMSSHEQPRGSRGRRFNRRSPFYIGVTASAGVAVTYGMVRVLASVSSMLVLIGVALFLAIGLEPVASWLVNRGLRRWLATTVVFVVFLAGRGAFGAARSPPLVSKPGTLLVRCRISFSKPRTTPRPLVGSMIDSISNNESPTQSRVQA